MTEIITSPDQIEKSQEELEAEQEKLLVDELWMQYENARDRGHSSYCAKASKLERFYMGGGGQWSDADKDVLEGQKRPVSEVNHIFSAVNSAVGYQINNRLSVTALPRSGMANEELAKTISKVLRHVMDDNDYRWLETDVFEDGLIQQRGYFDIRVGFDDSMLAECKISTLDPKDVIPGSNSKTYDPDKWDQVLITSWPTLDEIEQLYGLEKRLEVEEGFPGENDHGDETDDDEQRNKFGDSNSNSYDAWINTGNKNTARARVIERQQWRLVNTRCVMTIEGDIRVIDGMAPERQAEIVAAGGTLITRKMRRIRWTVATRDVLLFNDWSPLKHFTVVPYFPYFRRGKTLGLVDNAISPQEVLNKATATMLHAANATANAGWIFWENTMETHDADSLRAEGAMTGLAIGLRPDTPPDKIPRKIDPPALPPGLARIIDDARQNLQKVTLNDELMGKGEGDMSGLAIQSRQFAAQQGLAKPLDNLGRTRHLVANRILDIVQTFYDDARILRIRSVNKMTGKEEDEFVSINQEAEDGRILNDLTIGEYDIVIAEQPFSVTFENGQFQQALEMRKQGVAIPDAYIIKSSSLSDKGDIIESMQGDQKPDPLVEAEVALKQAQAEKMKAESVVRNVEAIFSATEAAQNIAALPQVAPLADDILGSSGYLDKDGPPLVPPVMQIPAELLASVPEPQKNTNPLTPVNPTRGVRDGIEGGVN